MSQHARGFLFLTCCDEGDVLSHTIEVDLDRVEVVWTLATTTPAVTPTRWVS